MLYIHIYAIYIVCIYMYCIIGNNIVEVRSVGDPGVSLHACEVCSVVHEMFQHIT